MVAIKKVQGLTMKNILSKNNLGPTTKRALIIAAAVAFVAAAIAAYLLFIQPGISRSTKANTALASLLEEAVAEQQPELPRQINDSVTMEKVTSKGSTFTYHLSLAANVDESSITPQGVKAPLVGALCEDKNSLSLLNDGATFEYLYAHSGSNNIYTVAITKKDCV